MGNTTYDLGADRCLFVFLLRPIRDVYDYVHGKSNEFRNRIKSNEHCTVHTWHIGTIFVGIEVRHDLWIFWHFDAVSVVNQRCGFHSSSPHASHTWIFSIHHEHELLFSTFPCIFRLSNWKINFIRRHEFDHQHSIALHSLTHTHSGCPSFETAVRCTVKWIFRQNYSQQWLVHSNCSFEH